MTTTEPANPWLSWDYVESNWPDISEALVQHVSLTAQAVVIAFTIALPLAMLAHTRPRLAGPILGLSGVLYTIPSLALFAILAPFTGIGRTTVLIGLVAYALPRAAWATAPLACWSRSSCPRRSRRSSSDYGSPPSRPWLS